MLRIPHCLDNRLTVNCEILATCSSTYSPVRSSQEAHSVSIKESYPCNRPWRPIGLWDIEDPTLSRQSGSRPDAAKEGLGKLKKIHSLHWVSIPRPSSLWCSALTITLPHVPQPSGCKIWLWVPWNSEPRIGVLTGANSSVTSGWGLYAVLAKLVFKKILFRNPKEWKPDGLICQNIIRKIVAKKSLFFSSGDNY
jgi:hypothetical protein